jgi:hypothetical protein
MNKGLIMNNSDILVYIMSRELPPIFCRQDLDKYIGGIFKPKTLKNMDSKGTGPGVAIRVGKKVAYEKNSFIDWFRKFILN